MMGSGTDWTPPENLPVPDKTFQEIGETLATGKNGLWNEDRFDRLYRMIDYAIKRQDWYEDQRNKALALAVTLLGLSSFLIGGLLNSEAKTMYGFRVFGSVTIV